MQGIVLYLIFIQSANLQEDMKELLKHSEYHKVTNFCLGYLNNIKDSKTTAEVRDKVLALLGDDAVVIVINAKDADAAWYIEAEDSEWLKQYL